MYVVLNDKVVYDIHSPQTLHESAGAANKEGPFGQAFTLAQAEEHPSLCHARQPGALPRRRVTAFFTSAAVVPSVSASCCYATRVEATAQASWQESQDGYCGNGIRQMDYSRYSCFALRYDDIGYYHAGCTVEQLLVRSSYNDN